MSHPLELSAARALAALRHAPAPSPANDDGWQPLTDAVGLSADPAGDVTLRATPGADGALLALSAEVRGMPGWLTLSVALGEGAFAPGDVLGVVAEFEGCAEDRLGGFVRTGRDGARADTPLRDALPGSAHRTVRTALHQVRADDAMAGPPGFHGLILELPRRDFTLRLHDMRIFVLDAARGVAVDAPGLAAG